MDSWSSAREVEKPKPIKVRAATAATKLIQFDQARQSVFGCGSHDALKEAIEVLQIVAGEKKP